MDFPTLMFFRATSKENLALVQEELLSSFNSHLGTAVPSPKALANVLLDHDGIAMGYPVLRFFLRLPPDASLILRLRVPYDAFHAVLEHLIGYQGGNIAVDDDGRVLIRPYGPNAFAHIQTPVGKVSLLTVRNQDIITPACHAPLTAVAVYASPQHFGMLWPTLTFARRALASGIIRSPSADDAYLLDMGFEVKLWPWCWPDLGIPPQTCAASRFMCPHQFRHTCDKGVMRATLHPFNGDRFAPDIAFRLNAHRPCRGDCMNRQGTHGEVYQPASILDAPDAST